MSDSGLEPDQNSLNYCEELFREAACEGNEEAIDTILSIYTNLDIDCKNPMNGWTALHWACRRKRLNIVKKLLRLGANPSVKANNGVGPLDLCRDEPEFVELINKATNKFNNGLPMPLTPPAVSSSMSNGDCSDDGSLKFVPNYLQRGTSLNGQSEIMNRLRKEMPTTMFPSQGDGKILIYSDLILRVRIANSNDPDFIEIEVPRFKVSYATLLKVCCEELKIQESQVERIRKLPDTRLRKDSDVKRLTDMTSLEVVLNTPQGNEKSSNVYQSISTCRDQTILY